MDDVTNFMMGSYGRKIHLSPLGVVVVIAYTLLPCLAHAHQVSFRAFAQADGLTELGLSCLEQDKAGYIIACTEHGLYTYDGQRFVNLGPKQGLPEGGIIRDAAFGPEGNVVLRYSDRVFVSTMPLDLMDPPESLHFRAATSQAEHLSNARYRQMSSWNDGMLLVDQGRLYFVDLGGQEHQPKVEKLGASLSQPPGITGNIRNVFSHDGVAWVTLLDGRLCQLGLKQQRCYGLDDGLPAAQWTAFLPEKGSHVLFRSLSLLATIDFASGKVRVEALPNQAGASPNYASLLVLKRTPSGELLTQAADGLMIRGSSGWRTMNSADGFPDEPIVAALFDRENSLWLAVRGDGVLKALGYGLWQNWNRRDGLSSDTIWQAARAPGGPLWVATDGGIDAVGSAGSTPVAHLHYDTSSYAVAVGAFNHVWRSLAPNGVSCITTTNGDATQFDLPADNEIVRGRGDDLWFATQSGLYLLDDKFAVPHQPQRVTGVSGAVVGAAVDRDGSVWILQQGRLLHRHTDGSTSIVLRTWKHPEFDPLAIALASPGEVWIGGAGGGLLGFRIKDDHLLSTMHIEPPDILSNTVVSLLVDRRGWLWVGTGSGISVYNGRTWISADVGTGLIWNDLSQGSLLEDEDGSIWIGTSRGLSHLLDPLSLFKPQKMVPVIASVRLGGQEIGLKAVPYSTEPLDLQFGALNSRSSVEFEYRMEGVDKRWAITPSGNARYPSLPPGHHRFDVVAYDLLTHQTSSPTSAVLRMQRPWWLWWPLQGLYVLVGLASIYGMLRLRFRYLLRQQRILHHEVELRTTGMRAAQAELVLQATQDSLTQLLTRGEIQKRLVDGLAQGSDRESLTIGLLDIDHFKRINDRLGHIAGDEVLREMGLRLKTALKAPEFAGRYGGEELLIVLNDPATLGASRIHELKLATCGEAFLIENESIYVTCSIGVARSCPNDDWKSLIGRADRALYQAKAEGRDRVIEAQDAASGD